MLEPGDDAPEFSLPNQNGETVSLSDFEDQYVVVYFYPKAKTRDCAIEDQSFRDVYDGFEQLGVPVVGIRADPVDDTVEFADAENLQFRLLSDEERTVCEEYDSFGEREVGDEIWEIPSRNTYIVGPDRTIAAVYEDVSPNDHPEAVLDELRELTGQTA